MLSLGGAYTISASTLCLARRQFLGAFGISTSDLPTAVAFSAARMRYAVLPQTLEEPSDLTRFIDGVLGGRIKTLPLEV